MDAQIVSAIEVAFNPRADPSVKLQAFDYINQLRTDASGWQVCLSLFIRDPPPADVVRLVSLEVVNSAIQANKLDAQGLEYTKEGLKDYIQRAYGSASGASDPSSLQNKLTQTLTYLFCDLYGTTWSTFFDDFRALAGDASSIGSTTPTTTILYLRLLRSIHDEIADTLVARPGDDASRNATLKDLVRTRDAAKIAASWQEILAKWTEIDLNIVELCLRCLGRWVSWIDISLVVNSGTVEHLWDIASQKSSPSESAEGKARNAAIDTLNDIIGKKMPSAEKVELITYLNISEVLRQLVETPGLSEYRSTSKYDTDLGEAVGKLTNTALFDIVKVLDTDRTDPAIKTKADELLQRIMPYVLRFFTDEYDEICWSVINSLTDLLTMIRRKVKAGETLPTHYLQSLHVILDSIITKMKYDETADWGAEDERTDEAEFQELRKKLHTLQQTIAAIDESVFNSAISSLVERTFDGVQAGDSSITWREIDLALYEMFLFGELAVKNGGLYQKGVAVNVAGQHLIGMMTKMVQINLASHQHPAVQLQYLEICVRYCSFFEHSTELIRQPLENFVRLIHSEHPKVRTRSWYLFFRFVKHLKIQLGNDAETVMQSLGDLLQIRAEVLQDPSDDDDDDSDVEQSVDAVFDAQLYLFEAIGSIASAPVIPVQKQVFYARSVLEPLTSDVRVHEENTKNGDEQEMLQVHHDIMAIGTLAKGFCEWMPGVSSAGPPPANELSIEFETASERILSALECFSTSIHVRTAARFSFTRMLGVLGARILQQLPRWIEGLLAQTSSQEEMSTFLRLLDQVVFGFKTEISSILDSLLTPLLQRVFVGLSQPTTGTDDELQLSELKIQYLNFILVILNNNLASVLVSSANQGTFETLIGTFEHFCRDTSDYNTARLSFAVLQKMVLVWGGPDVSLPNGVASDGQAEPSPLLPGFDQFVMSRFSPLIWALVSKPDFRASDAQARTTLNEAAALQWTILRKCGTKYEAYLRDEELKGVGLVGDPVNEYLSRMRGDVKEWRKWFAGFVTQSRGG